MASRITPFVIEEFYHIYNRGNSKQIIFHSNEDMSRFQDLLFVLNKPERVDMRNVQESKSIGRLNEGKAFVKNVSEMPNAKLVAIGSYCLMPNHFHILLTPLIDGGVSKFMQKLTTAYSMYYNKKYLHSGGLFEGKFKAKHIAEDRYLKYLFSYINLNPVKLVDPTWKKYGLKDIQKTFKYLEDYKYSSYLDFLYYKDKRAARNETDVLSLEYFPTGSHFKRDILTWFSYQDHF